MADEQHQQQRKSSVTSTGNKRTAMGKSPKERTKLKKPKERWLLTRKTWRYMADAGRKLIPDGALNRPEDVPKIEAYFQEVCQKEPRFLLWRKGSYPGALGFRSANRRRKERRKGGSCRTKASSADEADDIKKSHPSDLALMQHSPGGRFDIQKLKYDFLHGPPPTTTTASFQRPRECLASMKEEESEESQLISMLERFLAISDTASDVRTPGIPAFDYQELIDKLQCHFSSTYKNSPSTSSTTSRNLPSTSVHFEGDYVQKSLSETLSRYFGRSTNRERVISDLLTNRKLLEGLYFDLRRTKGFRSNRSGTGNSYVGANLNKWRSGFHYSDKYDADDDSDSLEIGGWKRYGKSSFRPMSPPPLIEIHSVSTDKEPTYNDSGIQTDPVSESVLQQCEEEYRKNLVDREPEVRDVKCSSRRRSSVDNDDVSQSVSDTIKRYLRMARKKSVDSDKIDRFKRVNYDRNLRNIKAKGEITKPGDDDGLNKGCQTNDDWVTYYKDDGAFSDPDMSFGSRLTSSRSSYDASAVDDAKTPSCPSSPPSGFLSSGQSFLSNLLHGKTSPTNVSNPAAQSAVMQKSKSSSSVMHHGSRLVAKKIFRSRSKSQSRAPSAPLSSWVPQGGCVWSNMMGKQVTLNDTTLLQLSDIERRVLQKVALAKLQALNLGVTVRVPSESVQGVQKSKRRAYLLKRKAKTTGFFDAGRKDDKDNKDGNGTTGLVFGVPLSQCIENERLARAARSGSPFRSRGELSGDENVTAAAATATASSSTSTTPTTLRRQSHHGSRASFSSLIDSSRAEDSGSCESLMSRERIAGSIPGLLDSLSCGSTADLALATAAEEEPSVPQLVTTCLRYLEMHGLHTLGIFRVSTSKKRVRQLREDFDCGKEINLDDEQCPHDIATLLKEYLRDLPDPILCRDLYPAFVQTQRIRNRRLQLEAIQHLIQLLPIPNRDTLSTLLTFLASVARCSNDTKDVTGEWVPGNKMDSNNLATVFAPNILHCVKPNSSGKEATIDKPEDRIDVINVIRTMIDHHRQLFTVPAELLDEVYIHMMDTYPEALDNLLNKKDSTLMTDVELLDDGESESSSAPWSPTTSTEMTMDLAAMSVPLNLEFDGRQNVPEPRKTWSREEFLHENAGTGGPNVAMRLRYRDRDRGRERLSKKRWRDDATGKKRLDDGNSNSSISSAMTIITRFRGQKDDETKARSSSVDSTGDGNDERADIRRQSSPLLLDNSGVITASLKIPMSLNLDDADIPYIEDNAAEGSGQRQMTIGVVRGPSIPPRRRQHSMSGSDSSQAVSIVPDSAVGSSTAFSSPPHHTASNSVASSVTDAGLYSSPPSWASTPPTSPDSTHTSVNYIPDEKSSKQTLPTLQKVSFTSISELQQIKPKVQQIPKSASAATVTALKPESEVIVREQKQPTSISSIGGAVLRSKTADFERMLRLGKSTEVKTKPATSSNIEKKKYTKRRYTDSRHETRHIPDSETLEKSSSNNSSDYKTKETGSASVQSSAQQTGLVYKRRELIASVPKDRHSIL